ncbi:MAG: DUF4935 domain-containing protein [Bdellovibrionales bacterium]|nr:DUF4935 domain-containing protein [Bdellovibrionales bacterium]
MAKTDRQTETEPAASKMEQPVHRVDMFAANSIFPDAAAVFTAKPLTLEGVKETACIVLDTNTLLVPYASGAQTLSEIETTYRRLLDAGRLLIPAQVAREFTRNRVKKLSELHQKLFRRRSDLRSFQQGPYPLLETATEYSEVRKLEKELDALVGRYREALTVVIDKVASWEWNDPVSLLYSRLFPEKIVIDMTRPLEKVRDEHASRYRNQIPPGYKDNAKDDEGIGDLLIWLTILEIGAARKQSVIFVSGDEKADWWHRSENQHLYPRYELVDEFRRASHGHSFHIVRFSRLLELFGASANVVAELREEESLFFDVPLTRHGAMQLRALNAERAVASWLIQAGFKVSPGFPGPDGGYDYLAEKDGNVIAIEVVYIRRFSNEFRIRHILDRLRSRPTQAPVTVIAVCEAHDTAARVEKFWQQTDPLFRLCAGVLTPDGKFEPVRPL